MSKTHIITSEPLQLVELSQVLYGDLKLQLSEGSEKKILECRNYLDKKIKESDHPVYGINTGFGSLYDKNITKENLEKLQENLVKSHACGTGDELPLEIVRLMLYLKIRSLAYGHSGIQLETVHRLIDLYNNKIYPVVYEFGSLGASGDLAPLAHLSLPLMGMGEVIHEGNRFTGKEINDKMGWEPLKLKPKEGLALLNGTQMMTAYGICCLIDGERIMKMANIIGALSLDAFDGRIDPFLPEVHKIRPHVGQASVASTIIDLLEGSELIKKQKKHVQDPYSFRCIPQVHGASLDSLEFVKKSFIAEVNGVTDNPNVFPEKDLIISAGNFHGQPLALGLDYLCIAISELGNISERRTFQLISGTRDLPHYLVANPGINSGLMIPQYTAASLVSKNKELCTPSSVDSIVSSNGQEDHVSMGANAATKAFKVIQNTISILAIELISAAQALDFRRPHKTSPYLEEFLNNFRKNVSFIENDRILHDDIKKAEDFIKTYQI